MIATRTERTCRLAGYGACRLLTITEAGKRTSYNAERIPSDWGVAFRLEKVCGDRGKRDAAPAVYEVCIDPVEGRHWCSCPGFEYRGTCRHVECLLALLAAGKLAGWDVA